MKNLTRRAAAALFAGAMLFGVAACGDDDDVDTSEELEQDIEGTGDELEEGGEGVGDELEEGGEEVEGELEE